MCCSTHAKAKSAARQSIHFVPVVVLNELQDTKPDTLHVLLIKFGQCSLSLSLCLKFCCSLPMAGDKFDFSSQNKLSLALSYTGFASLFYRQLLVISSVQKVPESISRYIFRSKMLSYLQWVTMGVFLTQDFFLQEFDPLTFHVVPHD